MERKNLYAKMKNIKKTDKKVSINKKVSNVKDKKRKIQNPS
jgi:hypothetical protein